MEPLKRFETANYIFERWRDSTRIIIKGTDHELTAMAEDTDAYRETAQRLGYGGDTFAMMVEHEAAHVYINNLRSAVIDFETGFDPSVKESDRLFEEHVVCAFQTACNKHPEARTAMDFRMLVWG